MYLGLWRNLAPQLSLKSSSSLLCYAVWEISFVSRGARKLVSPNLTGITLVPYEMQISVFHVFDWL